jgi:hypothetical protein
MRWVRKSWIALPFLVFALVAGCDPGNSRSLQSPTEPQELLGGLLGGNRVSGYTLVKAPLIPTGDLSLSNLIGIEGGEISLLGHTLVIPVGAVTKPTLFLMTVLPTGYIEVDLTASVTGLLGSLLDVGSRGFLKPVPVTLSYASGTNVSDPSRLTILRVSGLLGYRRYEVIPTVLNREEKTVTAELDHFSRYVIAMPN